MGLLGRLFGWGRAKVPEISTAELVAKVPEISTAELVAKLERGDRFHLVESLAAAAFRKGHLPGAINLPRAKVAALAPSLLPDKDVEIVVYCRGRT
jgi:rhodanese-related sulfurtransferase